MTGSTEMAQRGNIVETHLKITGLEYDTEYEVKLFAVNEQGDSEPDVRTFKTKSGMYLYLRLLTLLLVELFEMKLKETLLAPKYRSNTAFHEAKNCETL